MPDNQKIVILIDSDGNPLNAASNLSFNLDVTVTTNPHEYAEKSEGLPYSVEPKK